MTDYSDFDAAALAVSDPTTTADDLASIVECQPELWAQVASHPNAYPELLEWLDEAGDDDVRAAVAAHVETDSRPPVPRPSQPAPQPAPQPVQQPQPVATAPYPAPAQAPVARAANKPPSSAAKTGLIIVGIVSVVLAIALVLLALIWLPQNKLSTEFDNALADFKQAQADLASQVDSSQPIVDGVDVEQIDNPMVFENLKLAINEAQASIAWPLPTKGNGVELIRVQIDTMIAQTTTMRQQAADLAKLTESLQDSQLNWAVAILEDAIAMAEDVFKKNQDAEAKSLAALADEIDYAKSILSGLREVNPAVAGGMAFEEAERLAIAQNALGKKKTTPKANTCGGVTLPSGVDSRACGGMPTQTKSPVNGNGEPMFKSPSGNVGCWLGQPFGDYIECEVFGATFMPPTSMITACEQKATVEFNCHYGTAVLKKSGKPELGLHGDVPPPFTVATDDGVNIPKLAYGEVAKFGSFACLSAKDGITCWNPSTHHGFKISRNTYKVW